MPSSVRDIRSHHHPLLKAVKSDNTMEFVQSNGSGSLNVAMTNTPSLASGAATEAKQDDGITQLTSIATDAATLAGAVSGSEVQCDVVSSVLATGAATSALQTDIRDDHRYSLTTAETANQVVADGNSLTHLVSLPATINHAACVVSFFVESDDTTPDSFAVEVSYNGTDFYAHETQSTEQSTHHFAYSVEGFADIRMVYTNSSGASTNVGISSGFYN